MAYDVGLRTGDRIVRVNGAAFERFDQMNPSSLITADSLTFTVLRDGQEQKLIGPPNIISRLSRAGDNERRSRYFPGLGFQPPLIGGVVKGTPADSAGLQTGDRIYAIGADTVRFWNEMSAMLQEAEGAPVTVRWFRSDSLAGARSDPGLSTLVRTTEKGQVLSAEVAAEYDEQRDRYLLGVRGPGGSPVTQQVLYKEFGVRTQSFSPIEALQAGVTETWTYARTIVVTLKRIIVGRDSLTDSLGGPVMIAKVTSEAASAGSIPYWNLVAALSITLAIMNILPIPALDGGQLLFLLYEAVTRRRPSVRVRLVAQQVGMILLIGFMAFLIFNDIMRL